MLSLVFRALLLLGVSGVASVSVQSMEQSEKDKKSLKDKQSNQKLEQNQFSIMDTLSRGLKSIYNLPSAAHKKYQEYKPILNMLSNNRIAQCHSVDSVLGKSLTLQELQLNLVTNQHQFLGRDTVAHVIQSNDICHDEKSFVHMRMLTKVIPALEDLLKCPLESHEDAPRIALIGSGGGVRAQMDMLNALCVLHDYGLLDAVMYIMGLSGSTGAVFPYVVHAEHDPNSYKNFLKQRLLDHQSYQVITDEEKESFFGKCLITEKYNLPQGLICNYGASLTNAFLSHPNKHQLCLSELWPTIQDGDFPMPIGVAVDTSNKNEMWIEFNPCRITQIASCKGDNLSIPVQFAGRIFKEGLSVNKCPSLRFSDYLGISWSACALSHNDIMHELPTSFKYFYKKAHELSNTVGLMPAQDKRLAPYTLPNFAFGIPGAKNADQENSEWIDGGFKIIDKKHRHNLASVPALWRHVDIMIMIDSNKDASSYEYLIAAAQEAHNLGYKFPTLTDENMKEIDERGITVFVDEKADKAPIVVYIKMKENQRYNEKIGKVFNPAKEACCGTTCFTYASEDFDLVSGLSTHIVRESVPDIVDAINVYFKRKK